MTFIVVKYPSIMFSIIYIVRNIISNKDKYVQSVAALIIKQNSFTKKKLQSKTIKKRNFVIPFIHYIKSILL